MSFSSRTASSADTAIAHLDGDREMDDNELADIRNHEIGFVFQTFNLLA